MLVSLITLLLSYYIHNFARHVFFALFIFNTYATNVTYSFYLSWLQYQQSITFNFAFVVRTYLNSNNIFVYKPQIDKVNT